MQPLRRREALRSGAVLTAATGVVGVSRAALANPQPGPSSRGKFTVRQSSVPQWASWIPATSRTPTPGGARWVLQYDVAAALPGAGLRSSPEDRDPMTNPAATATTARSTWLRLAELGLGEPILGLAAYGEDVDPASVPATRGLFTDDAHLYVGSFDESAVQAAVDDGAFEQTDTAGVYEHGEAGVAFAWSDGYAILASDPGGIERLVGTSVGRTDRWHETDPDFEGLLRRGGHGDFTMARLADAAAGEFRSEIPTTDFTVFAGSKGFAQSASLGDDGLTAATTAVVYASEDDVDRERLEAVGTDASERSVQQEGRFVTIDASYEGALGEEASPTGEGGNRTDVTDGGGNQTDVDPDGPGGLDGSDTASPGMGIVAALAGLAGGGYLLARLRDEEVEP